MRQEGLSSAYDQDSVQRFVDNRLQEGDNVLFRPYAPDVAKNKGLSC